MFRSGKLLLALLPFFLIPLGVLSQELAPYSRFGLGQTDNSVFSAQKGIGGLAAAHRDPFHINFMNPASYSGLSLATLETGISFTTKNIEDGQTGKTYRAGDAFFDYLAFGFPAGKRGGVSFGMIPYSEMNYDFEQTTVYNLGSAKKLYQGSGRIYQMYAGGSYRFPKIDTASHSLSIGMNFVYLFGNLDRKDILQFSPQEFYNARVTSSARMSNAALNLGFQYKRNLNKKIYGLVGAYSYFPVAVNSTQEESWVRYTRLTSGTFTIDTVYQKYEDLPDMKIPVETGAGVTFGEQGRWMAGVEFKYKLWSQVESFSSDAVMEDSWEMRAGTELRPDASPNSGLFKRMIYRLGGFYDKGYLNIDGTTISEYGATFGFAIPLKTSFARLNFSFDVGNRGTTTNELIKETFFRTNIGFTFNDKWFTKPKYD
ncbi:MAG: hypothetical protein SH857_18615 [Chitinophagales bacterium]|nr:hypothetical protein [Chitinophagales bacterium]